MKGSSLLKWTEKISGPGLWAIATTFAGCYVTVGFLSDEFQPGEEVTNSFKKRRHRIEKTRRGAINALYAD